MVKRHLRRKNLYYYINLNLITLLHISIFRTKVFKAENGARARSVDLPQAYTVSILSTVLCERTRSAQVSGVHSCTHARARHSNFETVVV